MEKSTVRENEKTVKKREKKLSPLMQQYKDIKAEYPDAILFCRVGDFYETYYEDAEISSRTLDIVLTARDKTSEWGPVPMAGVPYHAIDSYLYKMVKAGYKVAICEQMEDPKEAKGLLKREVIRVITPGTITDPKALERKANNYLVSIGQKNKRYGIAHVDLSTGEFSVTELEAETKLLDEITRLFPAECLLPESFEEPELLGMIEGSIKPVMNRLPDWRFDLDTARDELLDHFHILSLDGFGCENMPAAISAAGALIHYLNETQKQEVGHILSINTYTLSDFMILDADTQRNLELTRSIRDGSEKGTLLSILDETLTPMGGRKLRQCILQPLLKVGQINSRLNAVEDLYNKVLLQEELREKLSKMYDMERLITRANLGTANARDLLTLKDSIRLIPPIKETIEDSEATLMNILNEQLEPLTDLADLIENAIQPEPPVTIREGRLIQDGYNEDLDKLRKITSEGKDWIANLQRQERERTGISSLKIGYNQVFGYYIEVTKPNLDNVPEDYIRKQTLTNAERFITPELKEQEAQILTAQESINDLEYQLFCELRDKIAAETERIQKAASIIAILDVLAALAYVAARYNYARPIIEEGDEIIIKDGRHPVVERLFTREGFVPNDTYLNCDDQQMHIITAPNMGGKSTYLRQVALITLMAQMGSFVPASAAKIGIVDRIFTRVGASDYLVMGQSTFLVEMNETANILNNATKKSLILLDEIGRGTSTFDGLSIAWAVAEYILDKKKIGAKTLFATHYHELIELENRYKGVKNYNVAVHEDGERIVFLRKVVEGGTDDSYGIQVARLAGLPQQVIQRANQILAVLEEQNISVDKKSAPKPKRRASRRTFRDDSLQLSLFTPQPDPVVDELKSLDLNNITPLEALNKLYELKSKAEKN
ncbi:TPA: DNA mismatch repair protein MutS [Candidatus Poribacteria bacterium]|nr:DNA mismatch repair protein MutS [Candidatus Poribacteria bacterium]